MNDFIVITIFLIVLSLENENVLENKNVLSFSYGMGEKNPMQAINSKCVLFMESVSWKYL